MTRVVGLAALCTLLSCGSARQAPQTMPAADAVPRDPRAEIAELDRKVAAARDQLRLATPAADAADSGAQPMALPAPVCAPAATETCSSVCTLADSICQDSARICTLADQLSGDADAAATCARDRDTCTAAHARCCGCHA